MDPVNQRIATTAKALAALKEALDLPTDPIVRDAAIQRFEFTFEALWKAARAYLQEQEGLSAASPKSVIRACFEVGILDEQQTRQALEMCDDRNLTVHTYNEALAQSIYERLKSTSFPVMQSWLEKMQPAAGEEK